MEKPEKHLDGLRFVRAGRLSTDDDSGVRQDERVCVIEEAPVTIDVEGVERYTILCTPTDRLALAVGFLFGEGVLKGMHDLRILKKCDDDPNTIRVRLMGKVPRIGDPSRNLLIVSSCGACGSEALKEQIDALPRAGDSLKIESELLNSVYGDLRERQSLFRECGGAHAAAIFDADGRIVSFAEDVGRHNALDKAIGKCLMAGMRPNDRAAAVTSRLSLEMVSKCARAGIELVAAVSAPTSLAIEVAGRCNITLCAFVRETRATVFTHPERILS